MGCALQKKKKNPGVRGSANKFGELLLQMLVVHSARIILF
jgi:hypothetical protein